MNSRQRMRDTFLPGVALTTEKTLTKCLHVVFLANILISANTNLY